MTYFKDIAIGAQFKHNGVWLEKHGHFSALNDDREEVYFQPTDRVEG